LIYSGFASDLPSLAGGLTDEYKTMVRKLPKANILTIWLGLKEQVFKRHGSEIWIDADPYTWIVPISNYDASLAPKDRQLVGCAFRLNGESDLEREKKRSLEAIYKIMPELESKVEMTHYQVLIPEKAMWTIATQFAGVKTPLEGVYLVGTDTEKRSMGVTRASYSVLRLLETLRQDKVL
jgi:phytoene dehydrogenase-like protein